MINSYQFQDISTSHLLQIGAQVCLYGKLQLVIRARGKTYSTYVHEICNDG